VKINFIFQQINKGLSSRFISLSSQKEIKYLIFNLRKFKNNNFFKETLNILIITSLKKKSSLLLANCISTQLSFLKKHNIFIKFLKISLILLLKTNFNKLKGIKILIKGRLNGRLRKNKKTIKLGKLGLNSINSKIEYNESTSFTLDGTIGVKVWICE